MKFSLLNKADTTTKPIPPKTISSIITIFIIGSETNHFKLLEKRENPALQKAETL